MPAPPTPSRSGPLHAIAALLRRTVRRLARLYYPDLEITSPERIPRTGPVLLVANHPNSLLDAALVGLTANRPVHFLAKAPLFNIPVFGALMRALGMIPAYRGRDDAGQVRRNLESLDAAAQWLVRGEVVGIFPEGLSHDRPRVEQIRSGAARLAIQAARTGSPVVVVPLGLNYECKMRFRSAVWVRAGEPIPVAPILEQNAGEERRAIRQLTDEINRRLRQLALHLDEDAWAPFLTDLEVLLPPPAEFADRPAAPLRQRKRISEAMNHLIATDRPRAEAIALAIQQHRQILEAHGLAVDSDLINHHGRRLTGRLARQGLSLTLGALPAAAGVLHHFIPYKLTDWLAGSISNIGHTTLALNRTLFGLVLYPLWYAVAWWLLQRWWGVWLATLWTACMPLAGLRVLAFVRNAGRTARTLWHQLRMLRQPERLLQLRRAQLELRHRLRLLATEYAQVHPRPDSFTE
jgi:1-acyl-sn-glycerol-3-phosphate acyltransferase